MSFMKIFPINCAFFYKSLGLDLTPLYNHPSFEYHALHSNMSATLVKNATAHIHFSDYRPTLFFLF